MVCRHEGAGHGGEKGLPVRQGPVRHDGREKPGLGQVEEGVGFGFGLIATGRTFVVVRGLSWGIAERLCLENVLPYFLFVALCVFDGRAHGRWPVF